MSSYDIGDKVVEKHSKRTGKVIDLNEEFDDEGHKTYSSIKIQFKDGQTDWITEENVTTMLLENS